MIFIWQKPWLFNTLRPRQNGRHFADDIFKCIFLNENVWISIKSSLKFVPKDQINKIPALVQIMAWRRPGDEPLSGPMMVRLPTHICVTRPQWVKHEKKSLFDIETLCFYIWVKFIFQNFWCPTINVTRECFILFIEQSQHGALHIWSW